MAKKIASLPTEIYQIKVTLMGSEPPIWRRLLVPSRLTLAKLHDVLQIAMGWTDSHMHAFRVGPQRYGIPDPGDADFGGPKTIDERKARLSEVLGAVRAKAIYEYDFGDGWEHGIVVEKILPPDPDLDYPVCTDGKMNCPPEDCGGLGGYYNLLDAIRDPNHEEHEDMLDWLGDDFDPLEFSIEDVNGALASLAK